jgi:SAM-dependent methyltransferase
VCVYHHVPPASRAALTAEVRRVLKVGGVFALIEHNPFNPATRLIVSRTPVDAGALLLRPSESRRLLRASGFEVEEQRYFLYLPGSLYRRFGAIETLLARAPLGGQYVLFGRLSGPES